MEAWGEYGAILRHLEWFYTNIIFVTKAWLPSEAKMADESLRVVEFYSGIGGMHFALKGKES